MANTFSLISSTTVTASEAAAFSFTSIPQTYKDLRIILSARVSSTFGNPWYDSYLTFNGGTVGTSYGYYANGTTMNAWTEPSQATILGVSSSGSTSGIHGIVTIEIPNYTSTTLKKFFNVESGQDNNGSGQMLHIMGGNYQTAGTAITSIAITPYNSPTAKFAQYSTAYLYGI